MPLETILFSFCVINSARPPYEHPRGGLAPFYAGCWNYVGWWFLKYANFIMLYLQQHKKTKWRLHEMLSTWLTSWRCFENDYRIFRSLEVFPATLVWWRQQSWGSALSKGVKRPRREVDYSSSPDAKTLFTSKSHSLQWCGAYACDLEVVGQDSF